MHAPPKWISILDLAMQLKGYPDVASWPNGLRKDIK
jgi:hypothetical protein